MKANATPRMGWISGLMRCACTIKAWYYCLHPVVQFSPLLILYVTIANDPAPAVFEGDEARYVISGRNLASGSYAMPDSAELWNGPGYPVFLAILFTFGASLKAAHLANAFLMFATVLTVNFTLSLYLSRRQSLVGTLAFTAYWPVLKTLPDLLTETLALFCVSQCVYWICHSCRSSHKRFPVYSSISLASLAMTKVIFGYVLVVLLFIYSLLYIINKSTSLKRFLSINCGALILCLPYLAYTFSETGRVFYWSTAGGSSLYWMSYPGEETLGEWKSSQSVSQNESLEEQHEKLLSEYKIESLSMVDRDRILRTIAIRNITTHPVKFTKNWLANCSRMAFNFPFLAERQSLSTCLTVIPNMIILCLASLAVALNFQSWRKSLFELHSIFAIFSLYLAASSLASAYPRMFYIIVPAIAVYTTITLSQRVRFVDLPG